MRKIHSYVTEITWERIHMYLTLEVEKEEKISDDVKFYLVNEELQVEAELEQLSREGNRFYMTLNVTNNGINRCVNNGIYTIIMKDGEELISEAGYEGTSQMLEDWGRSFRYLNNVGAYTVTCLLDEFSEESRFQLLCFNMVRRKMGHMPKRVAPVKKSVPRRMVRKFLKKFKKPSKVKIYRTFYRFFHKFCFHKNAKKQTILFMSEQDNKVALNMQALVDRMKERELDKQFNIRFSLRKATSEKQSRWSTVKMLKKVASAHIIIVDDHVPLFDKLVLNDSTKLIQIWHAGAGFKGVGYSRWGHCGCPGPYSCHRQYDFSISGSGSISEFFSEQFGILDEQIVPTGMPRMDKYLNKENREKVTEELYQLYPAARGKKVLLFAPTYRGRNRATAYYPYERLDFEELYRFCEEKGYVVFFKMHPWVAMPVPIQEEHKDKFFDLNTYPNINDLFYITDLLITDYSSSMYEFSLMRKPMMFFAYDKVQYSTSRGFHRDYDATVPGKICMTFEEIMDALWKEDFEFEKVEAYIDAHFDFADDHASDRIIDWLLLGNLPKEYADRLEARKKRVEEARSLSFEEYFQREEEEDTDE